MVSEVRAFGASAPQRTRLTKSRDLFRHSDAFACMVVLMVRPRHISARAPTAVPVLVGSLATHNAASAVSFEALKLQMRALQRPCTQILLHQSCYSFEKMSQAFSEMQSSMFDSKSH